MRFFLLFGCSERYSAGVPPLFRRAVVSAWESTEHHAFFRQLGVERRGLLHCPRVGLLLLLLGEVRAPFSITTVLAIVGGYHILGLVLSAETPIISSLFISPPLQHEGGEGLRKRTPSFFQTIRLLTMFGLLQKSDVSPPAPPIYIYAFCASAFSASSSLTVTL